MKRFEKFRKHEMTPLLVTNDDSMNNDTLCDSKKSEDDETEPIIDLTKGMKKLSLLPTKLVTFDLSKDNPVTLSPDVNEASD